MRLTRGLTLLELLVALGMSSFIVLAAVSAYSTAIAFEKQNNQQQQDSDVRVRFEERLRKLLQGAYITASTTDTMTYFLGQESGDSASANAADSLIFTTISEGFNDAELTSADDFETLNQTYGPQGGIAEVSLSMTPIGDQAQDKKGLFIREQRPADGDPTQGGKEKIFDDNVRSIQFEFYNGSTWDPTWGTTGANLAGNTTSAATQAVDDGRRIPAAVRITYALNNDPDGTQRILIVRLPHSDVTAENPVLASGSGTTTP